MRYIKKYNEENNYNNTIELIQYVKDILVELKDSGFLIEIDKLNIYTLRVKITKISSNEYEYLPMIKYYPELKNDLVSLIDYMESKGYHCLFYSYGEYITNIDEYEEFLKKSNFLSIILRFENK